MSEPTVEQWMRDAVDERFGIIGEETKQDIAEWIARHYHAHQQEQRDGMEEHVEHVIHVVESPQCEAISVRTFDSGAGPGELLRDERLWRVRFYLPPYKAPEIPTTEGTAEVVE